MFFRHSYDKFVYPFIVVAVLIAVSYRPKYHLRRDMPTEFFRSSAELSSNAKWSVDKRIAWAYWESAQTDIQWRYPRGSSLPPNPPAEFYVDGKTLGPAATDPLTRMLYWHRLQEVWYGPETWQKDYEWDLGWANDPLTSAGQWLREKAAGLVH